ncbi:hypothetical protein [Nonomuraea rhizosphaerae]|uniref:hypothetical protein n=1 Tax=Nonomuraea rhizosphaerae TaxID=2665663 RepID=UPI001C5FF0CA|nr:hypothetical protein [Nonomuraea rhizosphaerae]
MLIMVLLVAGIILTARAKAEHGRAAVLGMYGCVVLLVGEVYTLVRGLWLPLFLQSFDYNVITALLLGLVGFVFTAGGLGLLIWAVVARRSPSPLGQQHGQQPGWQQQAQAPPSWQPQSPPQPPPGQQPGWQNPDPPGWQNPQP